MTDHVDHPVVGTGTAGSAALLLRCGIGPAEHLREVGRSGPGDLPRVGGDLPRVGGDLAMASRGSVRLRVADSSIIPVPPRAGRVDLHDSRRARALTAVE